MNLAETPFWGTRVGKKELGGQAITVLRGELLH
jgi:hypothetical protein